MKKILISLLAVIVLLGCGSGASNLGQKSDMSGYAKFQDSDHMFMDADAKDVVARYQNGETFVAYFGFANCPWCNEAIPVLNNLAKDYNQTIYYVNTRPNDKVTNNTEIPDYDVLLETLGGFFSYDNDGKHHLYVPFVFFIKNGEVVSYHEGTTEDHDAREREMTEDEVDELYAIYEEGFFLMQ